MVYTEIKERNGRKYFYRVLSVRDGNKVNKKRKYLGINLDSQKLKELEEKSDKEMKKEKINKNIEKLKPKILKVLKKYGIRKAGIFGSYADGTNKKDSDVDILVEPVKGMGLEFVSLNFELEDKLGKKVDLVTYKGINPLLKERILKQEVRIL